MDTFITIIFIVLGVFGGYKMGHRFDQTDEEESELVGQIRGARELSKRMFDSDLEKLDRQKALKIVSDYIQESREEYHSLRNQV